MMSKHTNVADHTTRQMGSPRFLRARPCHSRCGRNRNPALLIIAVMTLPAAGQATDADVASPGEPAVIDAAELFEPDSTAWAPVGSYMFPATGVFEQLQGLRAVTVPGFPLASELRVDLELERYHAIAIGAQFFIGTDTGDVPVAAPSILTFRGRVADRPESWVVIGVTHDKVYGIVQLGPREEYWIAPPPPELAGLPHAVYERYSTADHFGPFEFRCGTETPPEQPAQPRAAAPAQQGPGGGAAGFEWRVVDLALEGDWEYRNEFFATPQEALDYMALLTAVISAIYERDMNMKITISYARVWNTVNDPYSAGDTQAALPEFRDYWNDNMSHVSRNTAHLLSGKALGGGRAYVSELCNSRSYGVNAVTGMFPYPVMNRNNGNQDILVLAHEMGHNYGSPHTHCYSPPIDTCAGTEFDCPNTRVCQVGTIMSYCHLCPGSVSNIDLRFHSRVITRIRGFIEGACPRVGRQPCYVDRAYGGNQQGTSSQPFNNVFSGVRYVVPGGRVLLRPGGYDESFLQWTVLNRPMRLERWGTTGVVRIGAP